MSTAVVFLIILVILGIVATAVAYYHVCTMLKELLFRTLRIEMIYNSVDRIECSCNGIKALVRSGMSTHSAGALDGFESDIKNIMNYSPSPKKRQEIRRKDGGNN